ncbi:uncharacterized protein V2V93DRAFT_379884 [Kockiozyma suomiensis]|uniref:uncharacterized protein n=1 Tax=Kockiozyma suomiensis TaxID=1337062 RepID=UPI003343A546
MSDNSEPRRSLSPADAPVSEVDYDDQPLEDQSYAVGELEDEQSYDYENSNGNNNEISNEQDSASENPASVNLFVSGLHPKVSEDEFKRLFEKYAIISTHIMKDPHTRDSRGFGFAGFADIESATAAKDELQGMVVEGRSLQIEFAKRNRPRTPTPGQYYGPNAKRGDFRGRGGRSGHYDDRGRYGSRPSRYDDRTGLRHAPYPRRSSDDRGYPRGPAGYRHEDSYREREPIRSYSGRGDYRDRHPYPSGPSQSRSDYPDARYSGDRRPYERERDRDRDRTTAPSAERYDRGGYNDRREPREYDRHRDYDDRAPGSTRAPYDDRAAPYDRAYSDNHSAPPPAPYSDRPSRNHDRDRDYDRPSYSSRSSYHERGAYPSRTSNPPREINSASSRDPYPPRGPAIPTGPSGSGYSEYASSETRGPPPSRSYGGDYRGGRRY